MKKTQYIGFGFKPEEWQNHFYVVIPAGRKASDIIFVYERYHWDSDGAQKIRHEEDRVNVLPPIEAGASCFSENSTTDSEELRRLTFSPQA